MVNPLPMGKAALGSGRAVGNKRVAALLHHLLGIGQKGLYTTVLSLLFPGIKRDLPGKAFGRFSTISKITPGTFSFFFAFTISGSISGCHSPYKLLSEGS